MTKIKFLNREDQTKMAKKILEKKGVLLVSGEKGVGKSFFAKNFFKEEYTSYKQVSTSTGLSDLFYSELINEFPISKKNEDFMSYIMSFFFHVLFVIVPSFLGTLSIISLIKSNSRIFHEFSTISKCVLAIIFLVLLVYAINKFVNFFKNSYLKKLESDSIFSKIEYISDNLKYNKIALILYVDDAKDKEVNKLLHEIISLEKLKSKIIIILKEDDYQFLINNIPISSNIDRKYIEELRLSMKTLNKEYVEDYIEYFNENENQSFSVNDVLDSLNESKIDYISIKTIEITLHKLAQNSLTDKALKVATLLNIYGDMDKNTLSKFIDILNSKNDLIKIEQMDVCNELYNSGYAELVKGNYVFIKDTFNIIERNDNILMAYSILKEYFENNPDDPKIILLFLNYEKVDDDLWFQENMFNIEKYYLRSITENRLSLFIESILKKNLDNSIPNIEIEVKIIKLALNTGLHQILYNTYTNYNSRVETRLKNYSFRTYYAAILFKCNKYDECLTIIGDDMATDNVNSIDQRYIQSVYKLMCMRQLFLNNKLPDFKESNLKAMAEQLKDDENFKKLKVYSWFLLFIAENIFTTPALTSKSYENIIANAKMNNDNIMLLFARNNKVVMEIKHCREDANLEYCKFKKRIIDNECQFNYSHYIKELHKVHDKIIDLGMQIHSKITMNNICVIKMLNSEFTDDVYNNLLENIEVSFNPYAKYASFINLLYYYNNSKKCIESSMVKNIVTFYNEEKENLEHFSKLKKRVELNLKILIENNITSFSDYKLLSEYDHTNVDDEILYQFDTYWDLYFYSGVE